MTPETLYAVLEATWPAAACHRAGPWCIREGQGGGQRVSAATAEAVWNEGDLTLAEAEMAELDQRPLFMIRQGEAALDLALESRGYRLHDPVVAFAAPCAVMASPAPDPMSAFAHWPPLGIAIDLWREAGIGPARIAVMQRACTPKVVVLGRAADRASVVAFVAVHAGVAMLHGLEVAPHMRRKGCARAILRSAAFWAQAQGAETFSLVVTQANSDARGLYASLGMEVVGQYHYRVKNAGEGPAK